MGNEINVFIKLMDGGKLPEYISVNSAGCDLYATENMILQPGETKVMPLNFIMAMDNNVEAQVRPRSGLSLKTYLRIPNSPGTIDSDYRNVVGIILENTYNISCLPYQIIEDPGLLDKLNKEYRGIKLGDYLKQEKGIDISAYGNRGIFNEIIYIDNNGYPFGTLYIKKGDRIAQMVFAEYKKANFVIHPNPELIGKNRGGGFGHSG
ncbi:MAG TPA: aminotransferase [Clostridiaceae bacterium]|nr:aminotransferase [Clostridiaceae bacterium]